jgi:hypothetical protein
MTQEEVREAARWQPFEPFRLVLTTGATYDIYHPDFIMVGRRSLIVGLANDSSQAAYERTVKVDLLHVVAIEELPPQPSGNGPPG